MAHWIQNRRKQIHLSQEQLAAKLQVRGYSASRSTVANWESDRARVPLDDPGFADALADALDMSIVSVLQSAGYNINRYGSSVAASRAAQLIDAMPPSRQTLVLDIIEKLATEGK